MMFLSRRTFLAVALMGVLVHSEPTNGADNCRVKIRKDGIIEVSAANVGTNPRWGTAPGSTDAPFFDEATCFAGDALTKCHIGDPTTLSGITPPATCKLCVGDDGPNECCAFPKGCIPGMRVKDASFAPDDPRIEAVGTDGNGDIYFTGVNVHIVNGEDSTGITNGRGNLIIGYNGASTAKTRTGSHNLVVGDEHEYSSYGGIVAGADNKITAPSASVVGGHQNRASAPFAAVTGGIANVAGPGTPPSIGVNPGDGPAVSGGYGNHAGGTTASVSGGSVNTANGERASISGGAGNQALGAASSISGGSTSVATGSTASVSGGAFGLASGDGASVCGGWVNAASGIYASVSAGRENIAGGTFSSVSGGRSNNAAESSSSISGGAGLGFLFPDGWKAGSDGAPLGPAQFFSQ